MSSDEKSKPATIKKDPRLRVMRVEPIPNKAEKMEDKVFVKKEEKEEKEEEMTLEAQKFALHKNLKIFFLSEY